MEDLGLRAEFWRDKRVLVTGHTGFKGAWLSLWLEKLGAHVTGLALPPERGGAFLSLEPWAGLISRFADIRDAEAVSSVVAEADPQVVFHLAAQALVRIGFDDPRGTFETNVLGTLNLLEACRDRAQVEAVVVATTDKVYRSADGGPYKEEDPLGGEDPYSASKACAEIVVDGMRSVSAPPLATARAGNVLGGGDVAEDRLLPDLFRALEADQPLRLRHPDATRPWQFVLDPLLGYLRLAEALSDGSPDTPRALNFGPNLGAIHRVSEVIDIALEVWGTGSWIREEAESFAEARVLELDSQRARSILDWRPRLDISQTIEWTVAWHRKFLGSGDMRRFSLEQISAFERSSA